MRKIDKIEFNRRLHLRNENISVLTYIDGRNKCDVICHKCGHEWKTLGKNIMDRPYCPICKKRYLLSSEYRKDVFLKKAIKKYGYKYDYSKVDYKSYDEQICIICPIHGEFWQTPLSHLCNKHGCPKCGHDETNLKKLKTYEYFLERSIQKHRNKYDYSKVEYVNSHKKVKIICHEKDIFGNEHGEFFIEPTLHWSGTGCPKCGGTHKLNTEIFIAKSKLIFGEKYIYDKTVYKTAKEKITITCPIHGDFEQIANYHLSGCGCPMCKESHLERQIRLFLQENNIDFEYQKRFDWLGKQSLDFYLPQYNVAIECQGSQHFEKNRFYEELYVVKKRDEKKRLLCDENNVKLIYFLNSKYNKYLLNCNNVVCNTVEELDVIFAEKDSIEDSG